jgi:bifunctional DNA-binding transcriptional regulator/antitoxin component of YhaV-PrlF toxin-antitoxin module
MVVELLAHKIRQNKNIKGITIGSTEIKLVQMADDTTVFVEDPDSLEHTLKMLTLFEQYAGLRLNKSKTEAMWLGKNRNNKTTPVEVTWVKEVHSLGIFFSYDTDSVVQKNFMDRAKEFQRVLNMWRQRDLSLIGKITILKSLAFSKVIYQCGMITTPTKFIEEITDIAYSFIWDDKPDKIKRQTLIAEYEKGGLKMLDIGSFLKAQKAMWVKRFMSDDNASWKAAPKWYLKEFLGADTFRCNLECKTKPTNFPNFYWQVMTSWFEIKNITEEGEKTPLDIRRECLWLNKHIRINKEVCKWELWHNRGINIINDIVDENGMFINDTALELKLEARGIGLKYNALKDAIPREWRRKLKIKPVDQKITFKDEVRIKIGKQGRKLKDITNTELYWTLIGKIRIKPIFMAKLQQELKIYEQEWEDILVIPACISNTKIRVFQYKLLFGLLPCNLYLSRINKSDTDRCRECKELDDSAHYLFECPQVVPFWNSFMDWWNAMTESVIFLDKRSAITGFIGPHEIFQTLNACLLLAKWHVYRRKLNESEVFFYHFLCDLRYNLDTEKTIAIRNDRLSKYVNRWQMVENYIT